MNPTRSTRAQDIQPAWFLVDADSLVLGRLATRIVSILRGKHKPTYTPHVDDGDFVVVVNARRIRLTGRKLDQKTYYRHTGYPGGVKSITAGKLLDAHPERVLEAAVRGMLPSGPLGRKMLSKLKIYPDATHPHAAQKPQVLEVRS